MTINSKTHLTTLLADSVNVANIPDCVITGLTLDSRHVTQGDLFFAYAGGKTDGRHYIDEALGHGAAAVICEASDAVVYVDVRQLGGRHIPIITIPDLVQQVGYIAARFYGYPARTLPIFGVTGTNGKTSITHLIAQAYDYFHKRCAVVGTIGYGFLDQLTSQSLTTPNPIGVQQRLAQLCQQGADAIAMEISSHALSQYRANGVELDTAIFTNLTRDHLNYHHTIEAYANAKKRLFDLPLNNKVINLDDPIGRDWLTVFANGPNVYAYSATDQTHPTLPTINATQISVHQHGLTITVRTPWGDGVLRTQLLGRFNVSNLLCVLTTLCLQGYALPDVLQALACSKTISGRMEPFTAENAPTVIVDFAHTPDALTQALIGLRQHCQGELWCVFGCGGDQDRGKRSLMARAAKTYADHIIVTDDNPRYESPKQIVNDILMGFADDMTNVTVIHARDQAIANAVKQAKGNDMILVAGKGHEPYQLVWGEKRSFSDRDYVRSLVNV